MNDMPRIAGADPATCARDAAGTAIAHGHRAGIRSQPAHLRAMFGLAVAACCWLGACGLPGDIAYTSVRGTVTTDGGTPIEGATVLVRWSHTSPGGGHIGNTEYCARLATATTDALGRFEVATPLDEIWAAGLADNPPAVTIWANGYDVAVLADGYPAISTQLTPKPTSGQPFNSHNRPRIGAVTVAVPMTPVQRDSHDTFMALVEQFDQADQCKSYGSRDAVRAHFERIAEQAAAIAKTRYERARSARMRAMASDPFRRLDDERIAGEPDPLDIEDRYDKSGHVGWTQLMAAAAACDAPAVRVLLANGADPNRGPVPALWLSIDRRSPDGRFGHTAPGCLETADALLNDPRTRVDTRAAYGKDTPLRKAVATRQRAMVTRLLTAGADPNARAGDRNSVLGLALAGSATADRDDAIVEALLRHPRIDLDQHHSLLYGSVLDYAMGMEGSEALLTRVLAAGANPNGPERDGRPLHSATINAIHNPNDEEVVRKIRRLAGAPGANRNPRHEGHTPLELARAAGRQDLVDALR